MHRARSLGRAERTFHPHVHQQRPVALGPAPVDAATQVEAMEREITALKQEIADAAQVQRCFTGPRSMRRGEYEIAFETFAARHISGDFCTMLDIGDRIVLAIGDIGGKGLVAGMWFTHVVSLIRSRAAQHSDPAEALAAVNDDLCRWRPAPPLTSMLLMSLHWRSHSLSFCRAGHPPAILVRGSHHSDLLHEGGPLLGVVSNAKFDAGTVEFGPGDALLAYSDGLSELQNASDEEFGVHRLMEETEQCERSSADRILFCMLGVAQDFAGVRQPEDDITMLSILRSPGA